jgi:DNA-directed RNA polymerase I, II, and III subunit RPABC2
MADTEDIIVSGGIGEEEEFDEDIDEDEEQEENDEGTNHALRRLYSSHPECLPDYIENVLGKIALKTVPPRRQDAATQAEVVISGVNEPITGLDEAHKSYPFLNKYESTRIIGFRANQLSQGARPFVEVPDHITDVREIARLELAAKRLPFIIKRPMPDGTYEYWRLQDLLQI